MAIGLVILGGCATKTFGRLGPLTAMERNTLTCREIALDSARTSGFIERVNSESQFDGKDVLAFLGDFGIGNSMEKSAAMESAIARTRQLDQLRASKNCSGYASDEASPAQPAAQASRQPVNTPSAGAAPLAPVAAKSGRDLFTAEKFALANSCSLPLKAWPALAAGTETYGANCPGGTTMLISCEYGNCRAMR